MRITDADDDYTVTADQRAALMELESLTWNYPTPQQARERTSSLSHGDKDGGTDESDDDDDDESYYVDLVPYDMTERLKEVNRALIEDPTPAECDRAITIRFREVIADYHCPSDDFPSDSDDGYGDSSDLLYDAEEDEGEGITSLTSEIKQVLGENIIVVDQAATFIQENESSSLAAEGLAKLIDVPKLQLDGQQDDAHFFVDEDLPEPAATSYVPDETPFLQSASYQEASVREVESPEIEENLPIDSHEPKTEGKVQVEEEINVVNGGSVSLVEVSDKICSERESRSLGNITVQHETATALPVGLFPTDNCNNDVLDSINLNLPAKSESDFASFDYSDDFEDFQEESEGTANEKDKAEEPMPPSSPHKECPPKAMPETLCAPIPTMNTTDTTEGQHTPKQTSLSSKRDQVSRTVQSPPIERRKKNSSSELSKPLSSDNARSTRAKRAGASTPVIKPALLSSDKLNTIKNNDTARHKNRSSTPTSSTTSSPLSSASSSASSSSSSSASSYSVSRARGRNRASINGPVRPTAHRSSGTTANRSSSDIGGGGSTPVRPPSPSPHNSVAVASCGPAFGGRLAPLTRVRKAASASDLHNRVTEETDDRRQENDKVFHAWLRQKNKQAAQYKKQLQMPAGRRSGAEVSERRAQAEEAFQVWLSRKRDQLRLEKKLRGERRRLEDQSRYARTKNECEVAYNEWCRRKRDEVRTTARSGGAVPRSQSLERPWMQEKTRKLYSAYLNNR